MSLELAGTPTERQIKTGRVEYTPHGLIHRCVGDPEDEIVLPKGKPPVRTRRPQVERKPDLRPLSERMKKRALRAIGRTWITTKEWAERMDVEPSNCASVGRRLLRLGLVERRPYGLGLVWRRP